MNSSKRFEKLLEPGYIGHVQTRNRIIKTANGTSFIDLDTVHYWDTVTYKSVCTGINTSMCEFFNPARRLLPMGVPVMLM